MVKTSNRKKAPTVCLQCGTNFEIRADRQGKNNFCNRKCLGLWNSVNRIGINNKTFKRIEVFCSNCNKSIFRRKRDIKSKSFYCSPKCSSDGKIKLGKYGNQYSSRVTVSCLQCQTKLIRLPNEIIKRKHGSFCNRQCEGLWKAIHLVGAKLYNFKGGYKDYYGPTWPAAKRLARIRDNNTCQICGKTKAQEGKNLSIHHKWPFRLFGLNNHEMANKLSNLITVCNNCHKSAEFKSLSNESLIFNASLELSVI
jgi:5-methylcytosine-specific restriction endonuclease McrA